MIPTDDPNRRSRRPRPTPEVGRNVLWHRESRRHKWRVVGSSDWAPDALVLMDGIKAGDWMLIDNGTDPNTKRSE